jgi:NADPH:quinone reductase
MARIVRLYRTGGPEELTLEEAAPEQPGAGEVRIRVEAIGLNNSEVQFRHGVYPLPTGSLPSRIGRECSGVVEAVGDGVQQFAIGEEVSTIPAFDIQRNGVYGEWCVVPETALERMPARLSRLEAAAVWQQYLTAYGPLVLFSRLTPHSVVLILAGASSVGLGAIQVAKLFGATVIATTRTAAKQDILHRTGADHVIISDGTDVAPRVREITGARGFDVALDPIAGPGLAELADAAGQEAAIFVYGQLSPEPTPLPLIPLLRKGLTIRGYTLWEITLQPERREAARRFILRHLESRALSPVIDRVYTLDEIVEAHRYLESGRQAGKVVVRV